MAIKGPGATIYPEPSWDDPAVLTRLLGDTDPRVREQAVRTVGKAFGETVYGASALLHALSDEADVVRKAAIRAVWAFHPPPEPLLAVLLDLARDCRHSRLADRAAAVLKRWAVQTVPIIEGRLTLCDRSDRFWLIRFLGCLGEAALAVLSTLIDCPDPKVSLAALGSMWRVSRDPRSATRYFLTALSHADSRVRVDAARELWGSGRIEPAIVNALIGCLSDADEQVRRYSIAALSATAASDMVAATAITNCLTDQEGSVRAQAVEALGNLEHLGDNTVGKLAALLGDPVDSVRYSAMTALVKIGQRAVPYLLDSLRHPTERVRDLAFRCLYEIAPEVLLIRASGGAGEGLGRMGGTAHEMIDKLELFYRVGEFCRERKKDGFAFTKMVRVLANLTPGKLSVSDSSVRRHLAEVSAFFRDYFRVYHGKEVPADDDEMAAEAEKIISRVNGAREQKIGAAGWEAWEETRRYLVAQGRLGRVSADVDKPYVIDA